MTRISLKEAYDNRDVIAWLVKHEDEINELMNILKDIDPNGDLTNVVTKTGDQTIDGIKTFIGKIVADCDIIQNGGNYETHAEQVFTANDYIVMRDGAVSGLGTGQFSGFQVKKYDGVDDGRLVIDSSGVARVGDVGDEQPLATRDEAADMTSGALVKWDNVNQKMIAPASNTGTDTKPIKIVNGEAVAVTNDLVTTDTAQSITGKKTYVQNTNGGYTLSVKDTRKVNGTAPASELFTGVQIEDNNGSPIGIYRQVMFPDGSVRLAMTGFNGNNNFSLNIQMSTAGTVQVFAEKTVNGVYTTQQITSW